MELTSETRPSIRSSGSSQGEWVSQRLQVFEKTMKKKKITIEVKLDGEPVMDKSIMLDPALFHPDRTGTIDHFVRVGVQVMKESFYLICKQSRPQATKDE